MVRQRKRSVPPIDALLQLIAGADKWTCVSRYSSTSSLLHPNLQRRDSDRQAALEAATPWRS
jgi:hypothetical protein